MTYRTAVNHTGSHSDFWGKLKALVLQGLVNLPNVRKFNATLCDSCPGLYQPENPGSYVCVDGSRPCGLEKRDKVVYEFARGDLDQKMLSAVFDARIGKLLIINVSIDVDQGHRSLKTRDLAGDRPQEHLVACWGFYVRFVF